MNKPPAMRNNSCAGFTLVEAIMVIVITGILAGMVAVFIKAPVDGYVDSVRRAELTDAADTALRLSRALGTTPGFWLGLQADYDTEEILRTQAEPLSRIPLLAA